MTLEERLLESLPQGALIIRQGRVVAVNEAMALLGRWTLTVGESLPQELSELMDLEERQGTIPLDGVYYTFSRGEGEGGTLLTLERETFSPKKKTMDGFFHQLRDSLAVSGTTMELLRPEDEIGFAGRLGEMKKSHYSAVRLLENMELLRGEGTGGVRSTLELVGYCQQLELEVAPLLREMGAALEVVPKGVGLFIQGDEALLQRLLLGLAANCIQRGGRKITLQLSKTDSRCKISLWDDSTVALESDPKKRLHRTLLATPDSLDVAVVRQLAKLLGGSVLMGKTASGGEKVTIALPLAQESTLPISAPQMEGAGRYNRLLLELCDVLPSRIFRDRDLIQ